MAARYSDDASMTYDLSSHEYTLTAEGLSKDRGVDLEKVFLDDKDTQIPAFLSMVSREGYEALLAGVRSVDKSLYYLSDPDLREAVKSYLEDIAFTLVTDRTNPGVFMSNSENTHLTSALAALASKNHRLHWRGGFDPQVVPAGFMKTKGEEW